MTSLTSTWPLNARLNSCNGDGNLCAGASVGSTTAGVVWVSVKCRPTSSVAATGLRRAASAIQCGETTTQLTAEIRLLAASRRIASLIPAVIA
nr:hypothetical protein [Defluviicoccus vanus]